MKKIKRAKAASYCCDGPDLPNIIKLITETEEYKKYNKIKNK